MNYILIGEIVNTHGLKGELRLLSEFRFKKDVFKEGQTVYLGKRKQEMVIKSYRPHKAYDMITFEGIDSIDAAIIFKTDQVFINRDDLKIDGYVNEDIVGLQVYNGDTLIGVVDSIMKSPKDDILVIKSKTQKHLIPFIDEFVINVDLNRKEVKIKIIEGLLNDN